MGVAALAGALAGLRLRILVDAVPSMVALAVAASFIPWLWVMRKRSKRLAEFEKQFPEALDFLARAIRAGHALSISLEMLASDSPEPVRSEFRRVHSEQHLGEQLAVVLRHLAERVPLVDVKFFVSAVLMQRETGGNLGEILTKLSNVIRERFRIKGQIRALSAHGRITATVLTILPAVTILGLMAINPDYLGSLLREPEGKYFIIGSIAGQVLGYLSMRRILDIKV
jgi:tight adherence protein B